MKYLFFILLLFTFTFSQNLLFVESLSFDGNKIIDNPDTLFLVKTSDSLTLLQIEEQFSIFKEKYEKEAVSTVGFILHTVIDSLKKNVRIVINLSEERWVKEVSFSGNNNIQSSDLKNIIFHMEFLYKHP